MTSNTHRPTHPMHAILGTRGALTLMLLCMLLITNHGSATAWSGDDETTTTETAILAGGCFWGMEGLIRDLDGVIDTEVGYAADKNDKKAEPAEAIRIIFDPERLSYEDLLRFYFTMHDPTTMNRQGNDRGAEYRSAIFVLDSAQLATADRVRSEVDASGFWKKPVVTEVNWAGRFKEAAAHHQDYLEKNPGGYTCHYVRKN